MPWVGNFVLESCTTGDMPLRVASCLRARLMACARRRPAQSFFLSLSRSIVPSPLQLLLTIAHQLLPSGSLCNLVLQPRSFRGVCFSVRPPPQPLAAAPPKVLPLACAVSRRESLSIVAPFAFHSALFNLLISLKPPLIRSPRKLQY